MKSYYRNLPYISAAVAAIIFGFSFLFTKNALNYLETFQLLGFRFLVAALFLTVLKVVCIIKINVRLTDIKALLLVALLQPVLYFICETIGVGLTSASESGIIISLVPIAITVFALIFLKENLKPVQWLSTAICVAGVILIILPGSNNAGSGHLMGIVFLLGAVLAAGGYNILSRRVSSEIKPLETTFVMMWVGAIVFNAAGITKAGLTGGLPKYLAVLNNTNVVMDLAYLGVISSVVAFFLINYSLSKLEASKMAVFMNLTPIVSVLAGVFIRGESFFLIQCVGAIVILLGVWGVNRK